MPKIRKQLQCGNVLCSHASDYQLILHIRLHCGQGRKILPDQKVHISVAFCDKRSYTPKAKLHASSNQKWDDLVGSGSTEDSWTKVWGELLEMDNFDLATAEQCVKKISDPSAPDHMVWLHRLKLMASTRTFVPVSHNNFALTK